MDFSKSIFYHSPLSGCPILNFSGLPEIECNYFKTYKIENFNPISTKTNGLFQKHVL